MSKPKKGRPAGSKNTQALVDVMPSRCHECDSTNRSPYMGNTRVQFFAGVHDGRPYTRIVRRRCQCLDCGQFRIDRSFENHPGDPSDGEAETQDY